MWASLSPLCIPCAGAWFEQVLGAETGATKQSSRILANCQVAVRYGGVVPRLTLQIEFLGTYKDKTNATFTSSRPELNNVKMSDNSFLR